VAAVFHTIGHSNHPIGDFLGRLAGAGIEAVADVRSVPYSRRFPQFSKEPLAAALGERNIAYVFLGRELGARRDEPEAYLGDRADYERVAALPAFADGLARLLDGARRYRIALMCAEREPLDCHRTVLVARRLVERGAAVRHILADGGIEPHAETERRLLALTGQDVPDLLAAAGDGLPADPLARAYVLRGREIAYRRPLRGTPLQVRMT